MFTFLRGYFNIIFVIYIYNRSNIHIAINNHLIIQTLLELRFIYFLQTCH